MARLSRARRLVASVLMAAACGDDGASDAEGSGQDGSSSGTVTATGDMTAGPATTAAPTTDSVSTAGSTGVSSTSPGEGSETGPSEPFTGCDGDAMVFEILNGFWETMDREYALFDIRLDGITWDDVGHEACDAIDENTSEEDLFAVLITAIEHLDDGHTFIDAEDLGLSDDGWVSEYPHYEALYELELNAESNYVDGDLTFTANDWVAWGTIGNIGYLSLTSMEELSNSGDEDDDVNAVDTAMAAALADLGTTNGMIVDVRANEGGWDVVSLAFARHFAGPETVAWSEQIRNGPEHDDLTEWEDTLVEASGANAYDGPVVVLSSGGTFSAGETFLLAIRVRDNVTILGERSSGHLSDIYDATLPGGWDLSYSGERYRAADGMIYEAVGIPVDETVAFDPDALMNGTDTMLEAALARLGN